MRKLVCSNDPPGLLAFLGGQAVGWCAVGPRESYPQYEGEPADKTWAIPCLSLKASLRGTQVARVLVEGAIAYAAGRGATIVEGPPPYWLGGSANVVAAATQVFRSCGFAEIGPGARIPVLRRYVGGAPASV